LREKKELGRPPFFSKWKEDCAPGLPGCWEEGTERLVEEESSTRIFSACFNPETLSVTREEKEEFA